MVRYEEILVRLSDGYSTYARHWPATDPAGAVLMLHGLRSHSGWYEASASHICRLGFEVLQVDRRGAGRNTADRGHAASPGELLDDISVAEQWLLNRTGLDRIHLVGISWGGRLAAAYHARRPHNVASLSLVTPGIFPRVDLGWPHKLGMAGALLYGSRRLFDIPLNDAELFSSVPEQIRFIRDDPHQLLGATASFFLTSLRLGWWATRLARSRPVPIHLFLARNDPIVDTPRTQQFVRRLGWPDWSMTVYDASRHTLELDVDREAFLVDLHRRFLDLLPARTRPVALVT